MLAEAVAKCQVEPLPHLRPCMQSGNSPRDTTLLVNTYVDAGVLAIPSRLLVC